MTETERNRLLEEMIAKVLQESMMQPRSAIQKVHVIFDRQWHHQNYRLWEQLPVYQTHQVHAIVPSEADDAYRKRVEEIYTFSSIKDETEYMPFREDDIILIPYIERNDAIWIAQGLACSYVSTMVKHGFQAGARLYIFPTSIEPLSGKEPLAYQEKILSYYRELLELGFHYIDHVKETILSKE